MTSRSLPLLLVLAAACTPQTAELTAGEYFAFMSTETSFSLAKGTVVPEDWSDSYNVDCRSFNSREERDVLQLEDRLEICGDYLIPDSNDYYSALDDAPGVEFWQIRNGYNVLHEPLEPWRGEAILTAEGDLQIGFHHRLPGGADFRFAFVVAKDFQPTKCVAEGDGVVAEAIDGPWVENWSNEFREQLSSGDVPPQYAHFEPYIDTGSLYFLNARGYQFNPGQTDDFWSLPQEWQAGFAAGKFADEKFHSRSPYMAQPELYDFFELAGYAIETDPDDVWYCDLGVDGDEDGQLCSANNLLRANNMADLSAYEWSLALSGLDGFDAGSGSPASDRQLAVIEDMGSAPYRPVVHSNAWRDPVRDGFSAGLDGWTEMHFNYVVIDGKIEVGEPISGAFSLLLDGDESSSRWLVTGEFDVPKIKNDKWTTVDLRAEKHEQNGTTRCSQ